MQNFLFKYYRNQFQKLHNITFKIIYVDYFNNVKLLTQLYVYVNL